MKTVRNLLAVLVFSWCSNCLRAQSLAINTDGSTAHSSAIMDVKSTIKGMLIPRMSKAQRNAIAAPGTGLLVYQNAPDSTGFYYYDGSIWKWLEEKGASWRLDGNAGTNPTTNFVGTTDTAHLVFRANNFELMRLSSNAQVGILQNNPKYALDINTANAFYAPCNTEGIRIKSYYSNNDCETGMVLGFPITGVQRNNALIWNYGQNLFTPKNIIFGLGAGFESYEAMRITDNRHVGIDEPDPKYNLDIFTGGTTFNTCTDRLGLRINTPWTSGRDCSRGLFMGYNIDGSGTSKKVSLWNFSNGTISNDQYFRFGFGSDFTDIPMLSYGESMRILPPGQGVGIGTRTPQAMLHIINSTGGGVQSGVMVTNPANATNFGFFVGLGGPLLTTGNEARIWNYPNADVSLGTDNKARMTIKANGNLFFGGEFSAIPTGRAYFYVDTIEMRKDLRVFGNARADSIFTEDIRITNGSGVGKFLTSDALGNGTWADLPPPPPLPNYWTLTGGYLYNNTGLVGINVTDPQYFLDVGSQMRIRSYATNKAGLWLNNDANNAQPAFIGMRNDSLVGFKGNGSSAPNAGWGLVMNTENGNIGIGTSTTNAMLQLSNSISNRKIVLYDVNNNDHQYYGLGINGFTFRYQTAESTDDHVFYSGINSTSSKELLRIKGNGAVGIGISNPVRVLEIHGRSKIYSGGSNANSAGIWFNNNANSVETGFVGMESDNGIGFFGTGTPNGWGLLMNISTGNVGIGTSAPTQKLHVIGNVLANSFVTPSDARYKKSIQPITNSLEKLQELNGVTYQFNQSAFPEWKFDDKRQYGLIAQEVEKIFPEMVKAIDEKGYKGVDYVKLIPVLLEAIKELKNEIDLLKRK